MNTWIFQCNFYDNCLCWCDTFTLFMCDVFLTVSFSVRSCWFLPLLHPRLGSISLVSSLLFLRTIFCLMSLLSTVKTNVQIIIPQPSPLLLEIVLFCVCHVPLNTFSEAFCRSVTFSLLFGANRRESLECFGWNRLLWGRGSCLRNTLLLVELVVILVIVFSAGRGQGRIPTFWDTETFVRRYLSL